MRYYEQKDKKQVHRMLKMHLFHSHLHCITYFYYYYFDPQTVFYIYILPYVWAQNIQTKVFLSCFILLSFPLFTLSYLLFHTIMLKLLFNIALDHYKYIYIYTHIPHKLLVIVISISTIHYHLLSNLWLVLQKEHDAEFPSFVS